MRHDGISVTALMALAAFAVERVTTGILFLLSYYSRRWRDTFPDPDTVSDSAKRAKARQGYKLVYFTLAGALVLVVVGLSPQIRILNALNLQAPVLLDVGLTCLVLVAGSDRIGEFVKGAGGEDAAQPSKPVEIVGRVILEDSSAPAEKKFGRGA